MCWCTCALLMLKMMHWCRCVKWCTCGCVFVFLIIVLCRWAVTRIITDTGPLCWSSSLFCFSPRFSIELLNLCLGLLLLSQFSACFSLHNCITSGRYLRTCPLLSFRETTNQEFDHQNNLQWSQTPEHQPQPPHQQSNPSTRLHQLANTIQLRNPLTEHPSMVPCTSQ